MKSACIGVLSIIEVFDNLICIFCFFQCYTDIPLIMPILI